MAASELVPEALISGGRRKRIDTARTTSQGAAFRQRVDWPREGLSLGAGGAFTCCDVPKKTARAGGSGGFALRKSAALRDTGRLPLDQGHGRLTELAGSSPLCARTEPRAAGLSQAVARIGVSYR